jgi:nucleotide-binding universal stress UspA family protein
MYRRILVAIDDSPLAERVLGHALDLARGHGAQVRAVHAVESPYAYPETWYAEIRADLETMRRIWRDVGLRVLERAGAAARGTGVAIETALLDLEGQRVSQAIAEEARRWGADLVVVGTHGRRGVEHLLLGSVAEAVARTAPVSTLLVRPG